MFGRKLRVDGEVKKENDSSMNSKDLPETMA
jgi:hypothetical protein